MSCFVTFYRDENDDNNYCIDEGHTVELLFSYCVVKRCSGCNDSDC